MKKLFVLAAGIGLIFGGCNKSENMNEAPVEELAATEGRKCHSHEILQQQLAADPAFARRFAEIEEFTQDVLRNPQQYRLLADGTIEIPVVVNVLYRTNAENISQAQIQSQIDVLNKDFSATNSDYNQTPSAFQSVRSGDIGIKFVLSNVVRKSTKKSSWRTDNSMKLASKGGINATSPSTTLNIWVCNLANGILGYAQFPGGSSATDGVVVDNNAMGVGGTTTAPFNLGRTATHEVGHWLNLRHIWGDATCGNDGVLDTPLHNTANYGCPAVGHRSTCSGTPLEMTMNYMDYTNDACMYMFSVGQKDRMKATFLSGGGRITFAQP